MKRIIFKNFRIVDEGGDRYGSVVVEDGFIKEIIGDARNLSYAEMIIDARAFGDTQVALMPAFIDLHAHFRDPGSLEKEAPIPAEVLESASLAAAAGGYGTVVCMANTAPVTDTISRALSIRNRTAALGLVDVYPVLSLTQKMEGKALSEIVLLPKKENPQQDMPPSPKDEGSPPVIRLLSEDGKDVADDTLFLAAMAEARRTGIPISCHCDLDGENSATRRALDLGKKAGCRLHIAHVSTKEAAEIIRKAKKDISANKESSANAAANTGFSLSCEATPHHIGATEADARRMGEKSFGRVNPPLRSEEDRQALIAAIVDGTVDALATDHAPHTQANKEKGAPGFSGLETAFAVCYTTLVVPGYISLSKLSSLMSANPARILGLRDRGRIAPGLQADFAVADLSSRWTVDPATFMSRGKNSPFAGRELCGRIALTIRGGRSMFWE